MYVHTYLAMHGYGDRRMTMECSFFKSQHDFNWFPNWILTPTNPFENYFGFNSIYSSSYSLNTCRTSDWMSVWRIYQEYVVSKCICEGSECGKNSGITQKCQLVEHISPWVVGYGFANDSNRERCFTSHLYTNAGLKWNKCKTYSYQI